LRASSSVVDRFATLVEVFSEGFVDSVVFGFFFFFFLSTPPPLSFSAPPVAAV
jgi:hypothetical protein